MKKRPSSSSPVSSPSTSSSSSSSCIDSPSHSTMAIPKNTTLNPKPHPRLRKPRTTADTATTNNSNGSSLNSPKSRSSIYRGVTRHRWTGRFEAHLWDKSWNAVQNKRGRQIYLGAYDNEDDAARTYDLAALKYWGRGATLNFTVEIYTKEIEEMEQMTKEEYLASLRRRSNGFSRGVSKYRGVARHHHNGRWEARIGRVCGNKYLYLGTFSTQEEAAEAYDKAALEYRGPNAITNFDINRYTHVLKNFAPNEDSQPEGFQVIGEPNLAPPTELAPVVASLPEHQENENQNALILEQVPPPAVIFLNHQEIENQSGPTSGPIDATTDSSQVVATMAPTEAEAVATAAMNPAHMAPEHPWDHMCLDMGFDNFPIPDMTMGQGSHVFDYKEFEDNIEFIFDGPVNDSEMFLRDALLGSGGNNLHQGGMAMAPMGLDSLSSPSLTSSVSTTPSICSDM